MTRKLILFISTGGFSGYSPIGAGTAGSLLAVLLFWGINEYLIHNLFFNLGIGFILLILGLWTIPYACAIFNQSDPGKIVIDEQVAVWFILTGLPFNIFNLVTGFLLFRVLDIWKPYPIRRMEKFPAPLGVMMDDLGAGVYVLVLCWLGELFF